MFVGRSFRRQALTLLGCALTLWSVLALSHGVRPPAARATPGTPVSFGLGRLPAGLTIAEAPALRDFFTLVVADLDADGDVDVIASNGALDLLVWINDGTGHLFRQRRAGEAAWQAGVPGPAYVQLHTEAPESVQDDDDDAPVAHVEQRLVSHNVGVSRFAPPPIHRQRSAFVRTPSSRGPPFARLSA